MNPAISGLGIVLIFIGVVLVILGGVIGSGKTETKWAVGGFIGPIPFGFGNNPTMVKVVLGLSIALLVLFFMLPLILRYFG